MGQSTRDRGARESVGERSQRRGGRGLAGLVAGGGEAHGASRLFTPVTDSVNVSCLL
jgi:hypothetical protein